MKKKLICLVLIQMLLLSFLPCQAASSSLTRGGTITLTRDMTVGYLEITKDTVLDLNGHTLKGRGTSGGGDWDGHIDVAQGATLTLRNGTVSVNVIQNWGTIAAIENVVFTGINIDNRSHIGVIRDCELHSFYFKETGIQSWCIDNWGSTIDLIENVQVYGSFIKNSGDPLLVDGKVTMQTKKEGYIGTIRNCRVVSLVEEISQWEDVPLHLGRTYTSHVDVVEDCIFVYGKPDSDWYHSAIIYNGASTVGVIRNCTIVNYNKSVLRYNPGVEHLPLENCNLIAQEWAVSHYNEQTKQYEEVPLQNAKNCVFLKLADIDVEKYISGEIPPPAPPAATLENFTPVNTYTAGQFADVAETYWGAANIESAYALGLMKGVSDTAFDPEGAVGLAQAVTMAARLHSIYTTGTESFVQGEVWYQTYVDYCKENGILKEDFADYNAPARRDQFAVLLAAALPEEALPAINTVTLIPDVAPESENAAAIYALYRAGILTGNDAAGTFAPDTTINRAAAAAILTRMADPTLRKTVSLP